MTKKQSLPKPPAPDLDQAFIDAIRSAIWGTWNAIGSDLMGAVQAAEGKRAKPLTNAQAIECVLDANYMSTNGWPQEELLIEAAIEKHGYTKVERIIRKHFTLA